MKTSLDHLPEKTRTELTEIVERIKEIEEPEKIILFGSHASGRAVNDTYYKEGIKYDYISDYDILVLYEKSKLKLYEIEDRLQQKYEFEAPLNTLMMYMEVINEQLKYKDYFYTEIIQKGILLFDKGDCEFVQPKALTKEEKIERIEDDFKAYAYNGERYLELAILQFEADTTFTDKANLTAHLLFQSAESLYTMILMVFVGYKPKTHNLGKYRKLIKQLAIEITEVFPIKESSKEDRMLFDLLNKAYIGGKYKTKYHAKFEDVNKLIGKVKELRNIALDMCITRIENLRN